MVADQHRAASRRDVLQTRAADMEIVAVEKGEGAKRDGQVPFRDAKFIHAARVERQLEPVDPRQDFLGHCGAELYSRAIASHRLRAESVGARRGCFPPGAPACLMERWRVAGSLSSPASTARARAI